MRKIFVIAYMFISVILMLSLCSCETDPVPTRVTITPADVLIHDNESVEFTASGGMDYEWSLEKDKYSYGVLSSRTGAKVTYTSLYSGTTVVYQTLYVTATIPGTSTESYSNAEFRLKAEAIIRQIK